MSKIHIPAWESDPHIPQEAFLVIGNGFDIECGLPTRYTDFLNFLKLVDSKINSSNDDEDIKCNKKIRGLLDQYPPDAFWRKVLDNYWYKHFSKLHLRSNWIDFENEIGRIIKIIESNMDQATYRTLMMDDRVYGDAEDFDIEFDDYIFPYLENGNIQIDGRRYAQYDLSFRDLRNQLKTDLDVFISGFEKYLRNYVEKIPLPESGCIPNLLELFTRSKAKYIICFNYTTTIERILKVTELNTKVCYIRGKIGNGIQKNQMVMGMDEYLSDEEAINHVGFVSFRKYNQRIIKGTDNQYLDWLNALNNGLSRMTYIFGHSLGLADRDVIVPLVKANGMRTAVYCYDEDHRDLAVTNLAVAIGKDELIKRTGGSMHTIEFRNQNDLRDK